MKKILFLYPYRSSFAKPITEAFNKLGFGVKGVEYRGGNFWIKFLKMFPIIGGVKNTQQRINQQIIKTAKSYKPDIIFVNKGESISKFMMKKIKSKDNLTINLFPEYLNYWDMAKDISSFYDIFLVFDYPLLRQLKKIGRKNIYYLPFGSEIQPLENMEKIYDLSFVGTWRPSREEYLKKFTEFNINIWGDPRWRTSSLSQYARGDRVSQDEMKQIIKQTKVNINIYFDGYKLDGAALRVFEVTGCGAFLLSQYKKSITELFIPDKEVVLAKTFKELKDKIKYYLEHEKAREKIALAGYQRAKRDHTWEKRLTKMFEFIGKSDWLKST